MPWQGIESCRNSQFLSLVHRDCRREVIVCEFAKGSCSVATVWHPGFAAGDKWKALWWVIMQLLGGSFKGSRCPQQPRYHPHVAIFTVTLAGWQLWWPAYVALAA
ncbi:unnamed protein product [Ostreobium quekettii]|uniref:Uncharacterized protein n=1 Tax=Ostreobium quekettii TaxID=121088 RepID=A0A8S1IWR1_9CHLO|nr:unnamed protein product [Ostreobium quekettii]